MVVAAGDVAEEEVLAVAVEDDLYGFGVVAVVGFTLSAMASIARELPCCAAFEYQ